MKNYEQLQEKLQELYADINMSRRFGNDCSQMLQEVNDIEKSIIAEVNSRVNDEFINAHSWKEVFMTDISKWDYFIYDGIVCRLNEICKTEYNEGSDTFNYEAMVNGIFMDYNGRIEFGYYDIIKILTLTY